MEKKGGNERRGILVPLMPDCGCLSVLLFSTFASFGDSA